VTEGVERAVSDGVGAGGSVGDGVTSGTALVASVGFCVAVGSGGGDCVGLVVTKRLSVTGTLDGVGAIFTWGVALQARATSVSHVSKSGVRRPFPSLSCLGQLSWRRLGVMHPNEHHPDIVFAACCIGRCH
jgi:hypothetical protein